VLIPVEIISSLEISRYDGLIRLPTAVRDKLGVRHERQFIYDNDKCLGNRLKRLLLISSNDFNSYLIKVFAAIIESEQFNITAYDVSTGPHMKQLQSIRISVYDAVEQKFYNYNAMKDSFELTVWLKMKALVTSALTILVIPYIIVTVGRKGYQLLTNVAVQCYVLYITYINNGTGNTAEDQNAATNRLARRIGDHAMATIVFIFFALIGMESYITDTFGQEALLVLFSTFVLECYYTVVCRTKISRRWFPRFVYLIYFFTFYHIYYYSSDNSSILQFSTILSFQYLCVYFYHHFELPLIEHYWNNSG